MTTDRREVKRREATNRISQKTPHRRQSRAGVGKQHRDQLPYFPL